MARRKNILLITSDQQHADTLGFRTPELQTPHLDRLAAGGCVFDRAYCPNPTCTPTRASIITGLYPSQHGAYSLGTKLPEDVPTVGEAFQQRGYRTALVGKAHFQPLLDHPSYRSIESNPLQQNLDFWRAFHGPFYGFEHVELCRNHTDEYHVGQHYALWMQEQGFDWRPFFRRFDPPDTNPPRRHRWDLPGRYHYNTWISERTQALLDGYSAQEEPFFLWASFPDPHPSYLVPEPWASMYDPSALTIPKRDPAEDLDRMPPHYRMAQGPPSGVDRARYEEPDGHALHGLTSHAVDPDLLAKDVAVYYGMISMMDHCIGGILDRLGALGLADDTLVVFTSDHGHFFGQHGLIAKCIFNYEDMLRVPFIAAGPGVSAGVRTPALLSLVDLAPTFLSACGLPVPRTMAGVDQHAVFAGESACARDHVLVENRHQPTTFNTRLYINERYKIGVYMNQPYGELYDLREDPGEIRNLWDEPESQSLKKDLLLRMVHAGMAREPVPMPRVWGA